MLMLERDYFHDFLFSGYVVDKVDAPDHKTLLQAVCGKEMVRKLLLRRW